MESDSTLDYLKSDDLDIPDDGELPPIIEGICGKCLGSNFVHAVKDGVLGVAFRYEMDGEDKIPIIIKCNHNFNQTY